MISVKEALEIHRTLIDQFGGTTGVRDPLMLESALNRPFQTFDQVDLYPAPVDKAAAICESIVVNHPFLDGNKRTGYVLMRLILLENEMDIEASESDKYDLIISVSKGESKLEEIKAWLSSHTRHL